MALAPRASQVECVTPAYAMIRRRLVPILFAALLFAGGRPALGEPAATTDFLEEVSALAGEPPTGGNALELLVGGPEYFPRRISLIDDARREVGLVMSLWCADESGLAVADALVRAAGRGVRVRVLVDYFNFKRPTEVYARLEAAGIDLVVFNPPRWGWRINARIHEKILVVDGEAALIGGANLCDEYMLEDAERTLWADYEILVRGPLGHRLGERFDETWDRIVRDARRYRRGYAGLAGGPPARFATGIDVAHRLPRAGPPHAPGRAEALLHYQQPYHAARHGDDAIALYRRVLETARRRVILQAPYVVPPPAFKDALIEAAGRGVEVILLTNGPETMRMGGFWIPASRVRYRRLLEAGVRIYESPVETVHGKAILVDDRLAVVGSHNFTARSFRYNGEVKVLTGYEAVVSRLDEVLAGDRATFVEITIADLDAGAEPRGLTAAFGRIVGRWL